MPKDIPKTQQQQPQQQQNTLRQNFYFLTRIYFFLDFHRYLDFWSDFETYFPVGIPAVSPFIQKQHVRSACYVKNVLSDSFSSIFIYIHCISNVSNSAKYAVLT